MKDFMKDHLYKHKIRLIAGAGIIFTLYFAGTVTDADANRYASLLPAFFSFLFYLNMISGISISGSRQEKNSLLLMTTLFSFISSLADFELYIYPDSDYIAYSRRLFFPISTFFMWAGALHYLYDVFLKIKPSSEEKQDKMTSFFFKPFIILSGESLLYLFLAVYPGSLSRDSFTQIGQVLSGVYTDHHPFAHTLLVGIFINIGNNIFHDINFGVALYCIFQLLVQAAVFSFGIMTLKQAGISGFKCRSITTAYALVPIYCMFSVTVWKDVLFADSVLLFIISMFRISGHIGKDKPNLIMLLFSGIGFGIFRSNGAYALILTSVIFLLMFIKKERRIVAICFVSLILSLSWKSAIRNFFHVTPPDSAEVFSIPEQQIAACIADGIPFSEEEISLINETADFDEIGKVYTPGVSDPVKNLIRSYNGNEAISANTSAYLKLWFDVGKRAPLTYLKAWILQTRGYWNAGYTHWVTAAGVTMDNDMKIKNAPLIPFLLSLAEIMGNVLESSIFCSIGLATWAIIICAGFSFISRRNGNIIPAMCVPLMAIIFTLLIATPVFGELRYAYALYTSLPFIATVTLSPVAS